MSLLTQWREKLAARKARRDQLVAEKKELDHKVNFSRSEVKEARRKVARYTRKSTVALPVNPILQDSWGWVPGVHDGIDLICQPSAPLYAMTAARVVRADPGGWWGLGAPKDAALKAKGDGIIIIECLTDVGPFRKGLHLCYGHAEAAVVKVGDTVRAGQRIGNAGFANAWHVHFMVNDDPPVNGFYSGRGDRDPKPYVDYCKANAVPS